ncbi:MAG: class I SAM-dependent methyltransferase [Candidatus Daviesbacteria bacterium]
MDDLTKSNEKTWDELVSSDVPCSRPNLKATPETAKQNLDKDNIFGDLNGKNVLCLASGGGQQSLEFALLGANVTVVDFSSEQLKKDKMAAEKLSSSIRIIKSDMRDLSMFEDEEFDVIYQPYSINYIPETNILFDGISRIIKPGGIYYLMFHNPFIHGSWKNGCWSGKWDKSELWEGKGYPLWQSYKEGLEIKTVDPNWDFTNLEGKQVKIKSPQEFKHTLSNILNGLIKRGFNVIKFEEYRTDVTNPEPGTWEHYVSITAPWLFLWAKKI